MKTWCLIWVLAAALGAGCDGRGPGAGGASRAAAPPQPEQTGSVPAHLNHAQPKLRTMALYIGTNEVVAELAMNQVEINTGMMFRESMGPNEGMLFVFAQPHQTGFYMKNTLVPLSVAYIDPDGIILEIHDLQPKNETPVTSKSDRVLYVLEMNQGWFATHKITAGAAVATGRGSLRDTFFAGAGPP